MRRFTGTTGRLAVVLAVALAARVAAAIWWQDRLPEGVKFGFGDSEGYWQLGHAIAAGEPYQYGSPDARVFRMPGYPLMLAGLFKLAGPEPAVLWARVLSAVVSTAAVGGVYWLGRVLVDESTGLVAAVMAALYPELIAQGMLVLSEAPFCALLPWLILLWHFGDTADTAKARAGWLFAAGASAGLATLVRPSWLLFVPFALVVAIVFARDRRRHLISSVWLMLGLCLVMTPWWIRNARITGHFVPTTLTVGASLYDGLNPKATGASNMDFAPKMEARLRADDARRASPADDPFEYRLDRMLRSEAIAWARAEPGRAVQLAWTKLRRIWNLWPNDAQFRSLLFRLAVAMTYLPIMALALWGAWIYCRRGWTFVLCILPAVYISLLHTIFVSSIRYRGPAMLPLFVLAAAMITRRARQKPPHDAAGVERDGGMRLRGER